jgi:hypothetical protein
MLTRVPKHVTGTEQRTCGPDGDGSGNLRLWEIVSFSSPTPCTSTSAPSAAPARSRSTSRRRSNPYCALTLWGGDMVENSPALGCVVLWHRRLALLCIHHPDSDLGGGFGSRLTHAMLTLFPGVFDGFSCGGPCTEAAVSSLAVGNDQNPRLDEEYGRFVGKYSSL